MNMDRINLKTDDMNMEFSVSSSYPTISNKYFCARSKKMMHTHAVERLSRSSFMSNGTFEQLKLDQHSRHSSAISNQSGGSKSSKFRRLRREGKMNLLEQKNAFVTRRHTQEDPNASRTVPHHLNLGMNMMSNQPQAAFIQNRENSVLSNRSGTHSQQRMNMSNINNVNVSFQFNIQPGGGAGPPYSHLNHSQSNMDDAQLQSLMASTLGLLTNLQKY